MTNTLTNQTDNLLTIYLNDIKRYPLLTPEEEKILAQKALEGDQEARQSLIQSNLRFVVSIAKQYEKTGFGLMDLINEGNLGLMSAVEKFDPQRGYHFISYAVWWIRQSILKAINEKSRMIRLPLNRINELIQIEKVIQELNISGTSKDDCNKIAQETGLDTDLIQQLLEVTRPTLSLETPLTKGQGEGGDLGDLIADNTFQTPEDNIEELSLKEEVNKVLSTLSQKEAEIIELRFGLNGKMALSLSDISEIYNLTKERIRQIEQKALKTLRHSSQANELKVFYA